MNRPVFLHDSGILNDVLFPGASDDAKKCFLWFQSSWEGGKNFRGPLLCYYEVRRRQVINSLSLQHDEPKRRYYVANVRWVDRLCSLIGIEKVDARTMRIASRLWAEAHSGGYQTAPKASMDADVIIAASAIRRSRGERDVVIITKNVDHLARYDTPFVTARRWHEPF